MPRVAPGAERIGAGVAFLEIHAGVTRGVRDATATVAALHVDVAADRVGRLGRTIGSQTIAVDVDRHGERAAVVGDSVAVFVDSVVADLGRWRGRTTAPTFTFPPLAELPDGLACLGTLGAVRQRRLRRSSAE